MSNLDDISPAPRPVDKLFAGRIEALISGTCVFCQKDVANIPFKDECSVREFKITGICQTCQDDLYPEE